MPDPAFSGAAELILTARQCACRAGLLEAGSSSASPGRETDTTAGLQNTELLQMQQRVMDDQDAELAELEKTVNSTKAC